MNALLEPVVDVGSLVNYGNEYEPRLSSAVEELFGLQSPADSFSMKKCRQCGNEFDSRCCASCPECSNHPSSQLPKPVTTCLTCGHDLPVIESQAESDRRYAKALAHDLRARGEVYSASLVERMVAMIREQELSLECRSVEVESLNSGLRLALGELDSRPVVTCDCLDTISDKLAETIDHTDGRLTCFIAEIEMPVCDDFTAAPLLVMARKDGFDFEFTLKSVLMRSHWRTRDRKFWCLSYCVEMA